MSVTPNLKIQSVRQRQLLNVHTVAGAGSVIGDATQIGTLSPALIYATGANATVGIKLPKAVAGKTYTIKNRDSDNAVLKVWPYDANTQINAIAAGGAISMAAKSSATFIAVSTTLWVTTPLVPS